MEYSKWTSKVLSEQGVGVWTLRQYLPHPPLPLLVSEQEVGYLKISLRTVEAFGHKTMSPGEWVVAAPRWWGGVDSGEHVRKTTKLVSPEHLPLHPRLVLTSFPSTTGHSVLRDLSSTKGR